jgi:hypothetical protein
MGAAVLLALAAAAGVHAQAADAAPAAAAAAAAAGDVQPPADDFHRQRMGEMAALAEAGQALEGPPAGEGQQPPPPAAAAAARAVPDVQPPEQPAAVPDVPDMPPPVPVADQGQPPAPEAAAPAPQAQAQQPPATPPGEMPPAAAGGTASNRRPNARRKPGAGEQAAADAPPPFRAGSRGAADDLLFGDDPDPEDYYGLQLNPADHIEAAAFQPSHILSLEIEAGGSAVFYEDVPAGEARRVVRGDWFVTSGDALDLQVSIAAPDGSSMYREGPTRDTVRFGYEAQEPASEGSFKFVTPSPGTYVITLVNPSFQTSRTVTFAWLLGRDDDDPFAGSRSGGGGNAAGAELAGTSAEAYARAMLARVSRLHQRIDEVYALQQYADVRFKRHMQTALSTRWRVLAGTVVETVVVVGLSLLQVFTIRRFDLRQASAGGGGGGGHGGGAYHGKSWV